jgi:hypothetical protein
MKRLTGDDEEGGKLKLGAHAFSDETGGDSVAGGYSRAIRGMRSFGRLILVNASSRQSASGPVDYHAGRGVRGPRGPIP